MDENIGVFTIFINALLQWKTLGAFAALAGVIAALVAFTKTKLGVKLIGKWSSKRTWVRSLVSGALGFLAGFFGALGAGKTWTEALLVGLSGVAAGAMATGGFEMVQATRPTVRAKQAAAKAVVTALAAKDQPVNEAITAVQGQLERVKTIPDPKARMKAFAAFANANPPQATETIR